MTNHKQRDRHNCQYTVRGDHQGSQARHYIFCISHNDIFYFIPALCQIINYADNDNDNDNILFHHIYTSNII